VVAAYAPLAERSGIDLGLARRDTGLMLSSEEDAVRTLASNLVDNALRYTPRGGHVNVSALRAGDGIVLEVSDDGPGIPPGERERVFDRFYRRAGTEASGSGLGLAIVLSIAERHGAKINLDSGPGGRGLTVRVTFPAHSGHV